MNNYFLPKFNKNLYLINWKYYTVNIKNIKELNLCELISNINNQEQDKIYKKEDLIKTLIEKIKINLLTKECIKILLNKFENDVNNMCVLLISNKISDEDVNKYFNKFIEDGNRSRDVVIFLTIFRKISDELILKIYNEYESNKNLFYRTCNFEGDKYFKNLNKLNWESLSYNLFVEIPEKIIERDIKIIDKKTLLRIFKKQDISADFFKKYKHKL